MVGRSIEIDQKLAVAYRKRGAAKEELCMHEEAKEDFYKALLLSNKELDAKQNDSWTFLVRGFIHISLQKYEILIKIKFTSSPSSSFNAALSDLNQAMNLGRHYVTALHFGLGTTYLALGCHQQALAEFNK
jgi:tetratricopeptide (TPR) repeat protein